VARPNLSPPSRLTRFALAGAAGLTGLLALEWALVFHLGIIQRADAAAYYGFGELAARPHVGVLASHIAHLCNPFPYVALATVPVAIALLRRRFLVAVAILVILGGANLTTELLKPLLAAPRPAGLPVSDVSSASWPSGHATAAMALALCTVLAVPLRLRPLVAVLGAGFAVAVCYSFLTLGWHYPSDALAGLLVASIWTLVGLAGLSILDHRVRDGVRRRSQIALAAAVAPPVLALCAGLLVGIIAVARRPDVLVGYARSHTSFVAGAVALAALCLSLVTGVLMTLRVRA
jgi:membrane-associated phospholipid phosphatase